MKRLKPPGGMIEYASITVSYAWELISVFMCYAQGDGFDTSLFSYSNCTVPAVSVGQCSSCYLVCIVIFGGTVMCYPGRY